MKKQDIIVIGASAGSLPTLKQFVSTLTKDFEGSIFIVLHIPSHTESALPWILNKAGKIEAIHPTNGDRIESGKIYVAPSDYHMIVEKDRVLIKHGPKENNFRPSIDVLFRSAALAYKERVIGVILSGYLDDGVSGLWAIQQYGGTTIIQSPEDTEHPQLPLNVLENLKVDYVLEGRDIGPIIAGLVKQQAPEKYKLSEGESKLLEMEIVIAAKGNAFEMGIMNMGELSPFTCPECQGSLTKLVEGNMLRYRCHTGHAYTPATLLAELSEAVESRLWQTIRALEEIEMLTESIADQYKKMDNTSSSELYRARAKESGEKAKAIREAVYNSHNYGIM